MPERGLDSLRHEVHVWLARPEPWPIAQLTERYEALLGEEERLRCQRFHFEHDRKHFLAAHAMLRLALAHYLQCSPRDLQFLQGPNGKPQLASSPAHPPLSFNLSHTRGMVACALALEGNCGIDVECIRPMKQLEGVAETVFSAEELEYLARAGSGDAARLPAFFKLWTLKEAYIKTTGLGMSAPLKQISIDPERLSLLDGSRAPHETRNWLFDSWMPAPGHALALASDNADGIGTIRYHELDLADCSLQSMRSLNLK